jgi:hypothetical protein
MTGLSRPTLRSYGSTPGPVRLPTFTAAPTSRTLPAPEPSPLTFRSSTEPSAPAQQTTLTPVPRAAVPGESMTAARTAIAARLGVSANRVSVTHASQLPLPSHSFSLDGGGTGYVITATVDHTVAVAHALGPQATVHATLPREIATSAARYAGAGNGFADEQITDALSTTFRAPDLLERGPGLTSGWVVNTVGSSWPMTVHVSAYGARRGQPWYGQGD